MMYGGAGDPGAARLILIIGLLLAGFLAALLAGKYLEKGAARQRRRRAAEDFHNDLAERIRIAQRAGSWTMIDRTLDIGKTLDDHIGRTRGLVQTLDKKLKAATAPFAEETSGGHAGEPHGPPTSAGHPPAVSGVVVTVHQSACPPDPHPGPGHNSHHADHDHGHEPSLSERRQKTREALDDLAKYWNSREQRLRDIERAQTEMADGV